jgi:type I restriction enzyme R subunit
MTSQTTERAFENAVEYTLLDNGWQKADVSGWDVETAIFPQQAIDFIKATQADAWSKIAELHGAQAESQTLHVLIRTLNDRGTLDVLRHGFRFSGQTLRVAFFKPANDLNPDTLAKYNANQLTITRQVPCHPNRGHTVDLLFALNGIPVATCELKNPMTGQSWEDRGAPIPNGPGPQRTLVQGTQASRRPFCRRLRPDPHGYRPRPR